MTAVDVGNVLYLRWRLIIVSAFLGAGVSLFLSEGLRPPPVKIIDIRDADAVTFRGGRLEIYIKKDTNYVCVRHVDQVLRRYEMRGGKREMIVVALTEPSRSLIPAGVDHYINSLDIPSNIGTGLWNYVLRATWDCPVTPWFLQPRPIETREVPVQVEDFKNSSTTRIVAEPPGPVTIVPVPTESK